MKKNVEVLAPAGSLECLKAAAAAGADAVYTGGMLFGARAYAHNLSEEELLEAIDYMHLHGKKLYLTVNTLLKEQEIEEKLYNYLLPYYKQGLDAVIVQDIGVFRFIRKHFPDLPIHASTQMTLAGVDGAKLMEKEGAQRIVTSRELSMSEVAKIAQETELEIESFVHGALCYCYSGQCLLSSFIGGRSGNRGQCAQPCRLLYQAEGEKNQYLLSLKDICTLDLIPEMIEAGIDSFKIEGRMKKPEYVAAVASLYRKYADKYLKLVEKCRKNFVDFSEEEQDKKAAELAKKRYSVEAKDKEMLLDLYNRGGFHTGYYHTKNGREMVSLERPNHAGVAAVQVRQKKGRSVSGVALIDLNPQDIIELPMRKGQEKADNYTCKEAVKKGSEIQIPVFADTPFQKGMVWNRTRNTRLIDELHENYVDKKIKEKLNGKFILSVGKSATLTVKCGDTEVTVTGDEVQAAMNQPMDADRIEKQMRKTGNTEFEFERLDILINGDIFLPMQAINEMRRNVLEEMERKIAEKYRRAENEAGAKKDVWNNMETTRRISTWCASAQTVEQAEVLIEADLVSRIYVDCVAFGQLWREDAVNKAKKVIAQAKQKGKEIYLIMPYIFREDARRKYAEAYESIFGCMWDGVLIRNYESFGFLKEHGYTGNIVTDYNLYQFNRYGQEFWADQGTNGFTAPLELTEQELADLNLSCGEIVVYGYLPMMVSAGCVKKTLGKCRKESGRTTITDRYRKEFVVKNECDYCYNVMYNYVPLYLADKMYEVRKLKSAGMRLMFTLENAQEVQKVLEMYEEETSCPDGEFTRGHWKKGIK